MLAFQLKRQKASRLIPGLGHVPVDLNQYEIFVLGQDNRLVRVGYVGTQPGAPINFIRHDYPDGFKQAVKDHVDRELGAADRKMSAPPPPQLEPTELEDEEAA